MPSPFRSSLRASRTSRWSSAIRTRGRKRSPRLECERGRVHAVAQTGRLRPVVEDVPQVRVAAAAENLGPRQEGAIVLVRLHARGRGGSREARPPGAGFELGLRVEEGVAAGRAGVHAWIVV